MSIAATSGIAQELMDNEQERTFWEVVRHHERPPYFDTNEGIGNRLARAARVVTDGRLTPNSDGSYTVEGAEGRTYRVAEGCSCPDWQMRKSQCYHSIAVVLYIEWQRRLRPPVELGTLRAGTLPLPPVTVNERLAQAPTLEERQRHYTQASLPPTPADDDPQFVMPTTPQEDLMSEDESPYIPEPDDVAVMDEPEPTPPAPMKIPREFTVNIKGKTHVLYTGLVIAARHDGLVSLSADWTYNDAELSLAHAVCTFADGRRYEESGDASPSNVSKGISLHFRRVALTRAKARCLRDALGISECSVEEMEDDSGKRETPVMTPNPLHPVAELRQRIWHMVQAQAPEMKTREQVETWIKAETRYALHPDNYRNIIVALEARA